MAIIKEVLEGVERSGVTHTVEPDRRRAITLAVDEARKGDIVLIAGKGHEKVQITRDGSSPFDDVAVAREALHERGVELSRLQLGAERPLHVQQREDGRVGEQAGEGEQDLLASPHAGQPVVDEGDPAWPQRVSSAATAGTVTPRAFR